MRIVVFGDLHCGSPYFGKLPDPSIQILPTRIKPKP